MKKIKTVTEFQKALNEAKAKKQAREQVAANMQRYKSAYRYMSRFEVADIFKSLNVSRFSYSE